MWNIGIYVKLLIFVLPVSFQYPVWSFIWVSPNTHTVESNQYLMKWQIKGNDGTPATLSSCYPAVAAAWVTPSVPCVCGVSGVIGLACPRGNEKENNLKPREPQQSIMNTHQQSHTDIPMTSHMLQLISISQYLPPRIWGSSSLRFLEKLASYPDMATEDTDRLRNHSPQEQPSVGAAHPKWGKMETCIFTLSQRFSRRVSLISILRVAGLIPHSFLLSLLLLIVLLL